MMRYTVLDIYDKLIFAAIILLLGAGLLTLYSLSGHRLTDAEPLVLTRMPYSKQFLWILLGGVVCLSIVAIDYHTLARFAYLFYGMALLLLIAVWMAGQTVGGARRWIAFGSFSLQPSEWTKVALLLALARYGAERSSEEGLRLKELLALAGLLLFPLLLVLRQPDLGTALALLALFLSLLFVLGLRSNLFILLSLLFLLSLPFIVQILWDNLRDYQKERMLTFMNPAADPMRSGWNLIQSKIAIGSGGLWGKGLFGGTQSQFKFLPEGKTDFIFSVFAEEWGFAGAFLLFLLFAFLLLWGMQVAQKAKDPLGVLIAVGAVGLFAYHFFVNIGMTLGMLPVVGVPLPFISYGGSAMVTHLALVGLLVNVKIRRLSIFY